MNKIQSTRTSARHYLMMASLLLTACLTCIACGSDPVDLKQQEEGLCKLSFVVRNYVQYKMPEVTRGSTQAEPLGHLLLAVYEAESGTLVKTIRKDWQDYTNAADDYGVFSLTIPRGHYRLLFVGHDNQRSCQPDEMNRITWEGNYVPDAFVCSQDLTVERDAAAEGNITLHRAVGAFRVVIEDALPEGLSTIEVHASAGSFAYSAVSDGAADNNGYTSVISIPESYIGKEDYSVPVTTFLFLEGKNPTVDFVVTARNKNGIVMAQKTFSGVPMNVNYIAQTFVHLFSEAHDAEASFRVSYNREWAGINTITSD